MKPIIGMSVLVSGMLVCVAYAEVTSVPKDGQLALPTDYKQWPTFLTGIQRADVNQVRDIYINPVGAKAVHGHVTYLLDASSIRGAVAEPLPASRPPPVNRRGGRAVTTEQANTVCP